METNAINQEALDGMAVAPAAPAPDPAPVRDRADAGTDETIAERLARNPESKEARLDRALDESMDASDPPASVQPVHAQEPPASSGYDPVAEQRIATQRARDEKGGGFLGKLLGSLGLR